MYFYILSIVLNYSEVKSFYFNEKGIFDYATLKSNFQKGKKNFVILDSDKIIQVISVVNNLIKLKKESSVYVAKCKMRHELELRCKV